MRAETARKHKRERGKRTYMTNDELQKRMKEYGADLAGVSERFMGDWSLYEQCLLMFCDDDAFDALGAALEKQDCKAAFEAAHALKGVSGNLGLTPLYAAVCAAVESLRAGTLAGVPEQYRIICAEQEKMKALLRE